MRQVNEAGRLIDRYIKGGLEEPTPVLYWPWNMFEVLTMLEWLRSYNLRLETHPLVSFYGIDPVNGDPIIAGWPGLYNGISYIRESTPAVLLP